MTPARIKTPSCVTRLVLEALHAESDHFVVTVFNAGNLPSFQVRINVYLRPGHVYGEPEAEPVLIATGSTTLGILERKQVAVASTTGGIGSLNPCFAVVFDPITDPFPTRQVGALNFQERNLLEPTLRPSLPGWTQFRANAQFRFEDGVAVPASDRTWTLASIADLSGEVPAENTIVRVLYPHATPGAFSELRQRIDMVDPFFAGEIRKGNVSVRLSCRLYTFAQTPRDRGALWLRVSHRSPAGESVLGVREPPLIAPAAWTSVTTEADVDRQATSITLRLLAERRTGQNNNAYFADPACVLKHRQVKLL